MRIVLFVLMICTGLVLEAQNKKQFKGYKKLENNSYLKIHQHGKSAAVVDTNGALFLKILFVTEYDSVFIDINKESNEVSYPMRIDAPKYKGDFLDILLGLHVGDSASFFMSLDSLHKYFPDEFVFADPFNSMKYVGMAVKVDSMYLAGQVRELVAQKAAQEAAELKKTAHRDSLELKEYLEENHYPPNPGENGIWYREMFAGTGDTIMEGDSVTIRYSVRYPDGTKIAGAEDETIFGFRYGSGDVISGLTIGLSGMRQGGRSRMIIPAELAYMDGNTLVFEVEIVSLTK